MNINNMCCNQFGEKQTIQTELNRLNKLLADIMAIAGVTSQGDILAAVRGVMTPEWISADLVTPTEPGWYWVMVRGDMVVCELGISIAGNPVWDGANFSMYHIPGTRYIKINQPVVK